MKINVNEYNEILSYEGTPVELAEFIATGILDPYIYDEDCGCEEHEITESDESVIVPDEMDEDVCEAPVEDHTSSADEYLESYKDTVREQLESEGYYCSDEEFEDAYKVAVEIMGPLKRLFE